MNNLSKNSKKSSHARKMGVIRATFSLPESAVEEIDAIRKKLAQDGHILNKSEVVRVGLAALENISERHIRAAIGDIARLKAGRPSSTD